MEIWGDHPAHSRGGHCPQSASLPFSSFSVIGGRGERERERARPGEETAKMEFLKFLWFSEAVHCGGELLGSKRWESPRPSGEGAGPPG